MALSGCGQLVLNDIETAFKKVQLGAQMLREKGWRGGYGRE